MGSVKESPTPTRITPLQQMVSSCSGAIITSLFVTPLDVVKIRLQTQSKPLKKGQFFIYHNGLMDCMCVCSKCANGNGNGYHGNGSRTVSNARIAQSMGPIPEGQHSITRFIEGVGRVTCERRKQPWYQRQGHFNGTRDAFIKIARNEGIPALWSGLPPTLVMAVPATVVYFTTYDQLKYSLGYREGDSSTRFIPLVAGSLARVVAATLISPLELIRTKMQSEQLSYSQVGVAVRTTISHGGLLGLMRGLGPTLLRDVPFSALYWYGYELSKAKFLVSQDAAQFSFWQAFLSGAVSGTAAAVITLPFDVIKTHRQIELGQADVLKKSEPSSTWSLIQRLYHQKGLPGLFTGIVPRVIKIAPACAIMISTYEYGKMFFRNHNAQMLALEEGT